MKKIEIGVWSLISIIFLFGIYTLCAPPFKFEDKKTKEVQVKHGTLIASTLTNLNAGKPRLTASTISVKDSFDTQQDQINKLRARLDSIEQRAFEKERSK